MVVRKALRAFRERAGPSIPRTMRTGGSAAREQMTRERRSLEPRRSRHATPRPFSPPGLGRSPGRNGSARWCLSEHRRRLGTKFNLGVNYLIPERLTSTEREVIETMKNDGENVAVESVLCTLSRESTRCSFCTFRRRKVMEQLCLRRISESGRRKPSRSVGATAAAGRSKMSTNSSSTTSSQRHSQRIIAYGYSTSYSRYYSTISGVLPNS